MSAPESEVRRHQAAEVDSGRRLVGVGVGSGGDGGGFLRFRGVGLSPADDVINHGIHGL